MDAPIITELPEITIANREELEAYFAAVEEGIDYLSLPVDSPYFVG